MNNLEEFIFWFENLKESDVKNLDKFYTNDVFFKDPFNEFMSIKKLTKIFAHMFDELTNPRFVIIDSFHQNDQSFLTWDFIFSKAGREIKIHGSTHLKWENEKVKYHRDYWDVGEEVLQKIPIIKSIYKLSTSRLRVD